MPFNPSRRVLILVENLPVPLDRRVWLEASSLVEAGYQVSVICPMGRGWIKPYELIDGVHIYRYPEPVEAHSGAVAYAREYLHALWHMFRLARVVKRERGFDVIHGCNPPDLMFLLGLRYRLSGVRYLFDHHDVSPELFEAKFNKRGLLYQIMLIWERMTFAAADVSMATNESFRKIAIRRGKMQPEDVFVVRSAPKVETFLPGPGKAEYRRGAKTVMGYIGVIGQQEGMDLLVIAAEHLIRKLDKRDVHFLIVGFGPTLEEVKADVKSRGLDRYFTFTGALFGEEISTMNKVMEYMTLEKPVVQFDLTEGRASAGDASLYAQANDPIDLARKIAELIDNPEAGRQMGLRGRKRVLEEFSWQHSVPHLLAAYERIFSKRR
jgi:glycosyltransferase involved in cell wall biosynthesis